MNDTKETGIRRLAQKHPLIGKLISAASVAICLSAIAYVFYYSMLGGPYH